jgi:hypothetical protein
MEAFVVFQSYLDVLSVGSTIVLGSMDDNTSTLATELSTRPLEECSEMIQLSH